MEGLRIRTIYLVVTGIVVSSCSHIKPAQTQFSVDRDSTITEAGESPVKLKLGEKLEVGKKPILVESPGYTSVFLIPNIDSKNDLQLTMKPMDLDQTSSIIQKKYHKNLTEILTDIYRVQNHLALSEVSEAITKVNKLIEKYPHIAYFKFLQASCYVMKGNKKRSKEILEVALSEYPDHPEGLRLYRSLLSPGEKNKFANKTGAQ